MKQITLQDRLNNKIEGYKKEIGKHNSFMANFEMNNYDVSILKQAGEHIKKYLELLESFKTVKPTETAEQANKKSKKSK